MKSDNGIVNYFESDYTQIDNRNLMKHHDWGADQDFNPLDLKFSLIRFLHSLSHMGMKSSIWYWPVIFTGTVSFISIHIRPI